MKTVPSIALCALTLGSVVLAGCSFAARSPEMYRDDTKAVLESKNNEIRACYDAVLKSTPGVGGKVTVTFEVETEAGKIINVAVDGTNTTAPPAIADCVTKNLVGLAIAPPDKNTGQGSFVYDFSVAPHG